MSDTDRGERTVVYFRTYLQVGVNESIRIFTLISSVTHNATLLGSCMPLGRSSPARPRASPRRDVPFPLRGARGSLISYITSFYFVSSSVVRTVDTARAHALGLTDCLTTRPSHSVHSDSNMHLCVLPCCRAPPCSCARSQESCSPKSVTHSRVSSRRLFRGLSLEAACTHCYLFRLDPVSPLRPLRLM
jgi:hypothetical protein